MKPQAEPLNRAGSSPRADRLSAPESRRDSRRDGAEPATRRTRVRAAAAPDRSRCPRSSGPRRPRCSRWRPAPCSRAPATTAPGSNEPVRDRAAIALLAWPLLFAGMWGWSGADRPSRTDAALFAALAVLIALLVVRARARGDPLGFSRTRFLPALRALAAPTALLVVAAAAWGLACGRRPAGGRGRSLARRLPGLVAAATARPAGAALAAPASRRRRRTRPARDDRAAVRARPLAQRPAHAGLPGRDARLGAGVGARTVAAGRRTRHGDHRDGPRAVRTAPRLRARPHRPARGASPVDHGARRRGRHRRHHRRAGCWCAPSSRPRSAAPPSTPRPPPGRARSRRACASGSSGSSSPARSCALARRTGRCRPRRGSRCRTSRGAAAS